MYICVHMLISIHEGNLMYTKVVVQLARSIQLENNKQLALGAMWRERI